MRDETAVAEKPVPSITLSIAQDDVKRVLEASEALAKSFTSIVKDETDIKRTPLPVATLAQDSAKKEDKGESGVLKGNGTKLGTNADKTEDETDKETTSPSDEDGSPSINPRRPLHELVYEAAKKCEHSMMHDFIEKMKAAGVSPLEIRAGVLIFHDLKMKRKMQMIFDVLGKKSAVDTSTSTSADISYLTRDGAISLFRSVIVAISSCIHKDKRVQIEMEKGTVSAEPPSKRRKLQPSSPESDKSLKTSCGDDSVPTLQSPSRSFDSSLETVGDDDLLTHGVRKEFEDIAIYATERLFRFCNKKGLVSKEFASIDFEAFEAWRKNESSKIAPWLALLDLETWKPPPRPSNRSTTTSAPTATSAPTTTSLPATKKDTELTEEKADLVQTESKLQTKNEKSPPVASKKGSDEQAVPEATLPPKMAIKTEPEPPINASSPTVSLTYTESIPSRTVVSFDFTGSVPEASKSSSFCINISEDNLLTLHRLVIGTGLAKRPIADISEVLFQTSEEKEKKKIVTVESFKKCVKDLINDKAESGLSQEDRDVFFSCLVDLFECFDSRLGDSEDSVFRDELSVGFSILAAGSKSIKLAFGFEQLESSPQSGLTTEQLTSFIRSYLTMLCGISLLTSSPKGVLKPKLNSARHQAMKQSIETGSKWTMAHFLKTTGASRGDTHSFERFAGWYTAGGFNVAPWLELLDLKKLFALVGQPLSIESPTPKTQIRGANHEFTSPKPQTPSYSSPQTPHFGATPLGDPFASMASTPASHVLFTFPLANQRSLVVLKEDATYVRTVVEQLGLTSVLPDELWSSLLCAAQRQPPIAPHRGVKETKTQSSSKALPVNRETFLQSMQEIIKDKNGRLKPSSNAVTSIAEARDVLANFFHSYDLLQVDRVALNELMGGLTLLCGGKKSTKLAFAFGVFDQRSNQKGKRNKKAQNGHSLSGEELFLFLRSFLIVMFSCCRQSWDLSDDAVNRYIADTANMLTDDVMRYQWRTRKKDRVDFDEFGQWYNEGGFETAPWLELLDLKKWVFEDNGLDKFDLNLAATSPGLLGKNLADDVCPPAPPDDSMDDSFFDDDGAVLMPMDSIDEMDLLLMQPDKEGETELNKLSGTFTHSPRREQVIEQPPKKSTSLKFQLITGDRNIGYIVSVSQKRIKHLRQLLVESGLSSIDVEDACKHIIGKSFRDEKTGGYFLTKEDFDSAMRKIVSSKHIGIESQQVLSSILGEIFHAFDHANSGRVDAKEVACGFTVFCKGKKSDKLEYAFEVLDRTRRGKLSNADTTKYLRSFLTVLLNVVFTSSLDTDQDDQMTTSSGRKCERTTSSIAEAVNAGSTWASTQAFNSQRANDGFICFDEFAHWYTTVGFSNIPWLELLDLHKWVILDS